MRPSRLMSSAIFFTSKFIDVFNLGGAHYIFLWRCLEEVFYVVVWAFQKYYLLFLRRQKRLVTVFFRTVLFVSFTDRRWYREIWYLVSCLEIQARSLLSAYHFHAFLVKINGLSCAFVLLRFQSSRLVWSSMIRRME